MEATSLFVFKVLSIASRVARRQSHSSLRPSPLSDAENLLSWSPHCPQTLDFSPHEGPLVAPWKRSSDSEERIKFDSGQGMPQAIRADSGTEPWWG